MSLYESLWIPISLFASPENELKDGLQIFEANFYGAEFGAPDSDSIPYGYFRYFEVHSTSFDGNLGLDSKAFGGETHKL